MNIKAFWQKSRSSPIINIDYRLLNACLKTIHAHIIFSIKLTDLHGEIRWPVGDRADRRVWDLRPQQLLDPETEERRRDFTSKHQEYQQLKAVFLFRESADSRFSLPQAEHYNEDCDEQKTETHHHHDHLHFPISFRDQTHITNESKSRFSSTYKTSGALKSTPNTYRTSAF